MMIWRTFGLCRSSIPFLSLLFLLPLSLDAQLSGEYVVGDGGDFTTLSEAVEALNVKGIDGPTTFRIMKGRYEEQVLVSNVRRSARTSPIVFESFDGDPASVTIFYQHLGSSANNNEHVIRIDTTDDVTIRSMTIENPGEIYGTGVRVTSSADVKLEDLIVKVTPEPLFQQPLNSCLFLYDVRGIAISRCTLTGGYTGVAGLGVDDSTLADGIVVRECRMANGVTGGGGSAVWLKNYRNATIQGISVDQKDGSGITLDNCRGISRVVGNRITLRPIRFGNGISVQNCRGEGAPLLVANNAVMVFGGDTLTACTGLYVNTTTRADFIHNSVHLSNGNTSRFQSTLNVTVSLATFGNDSLRIFNNIFTNLQGREVITYPVGNVTFESDYNNLYTTGDLLGSTPSGAVKTLEDLQQASGQELHSFSSPPCYSAKDDLQTHSPILDGTALPFPEVATDIDGMPRSSTTPDIGAWEYDYVPHGLAGTYSVGAGGDYETLQEGLEDLHTRCIEGPVDFALLGGEHRGRFTIDSIPGVRNDQRITLRSSSGDREDAVIAGQPEFFNDYILRLRNAHHIDIRDLTIRPLDSIYTMVGLWLVRSPVDIIIEGNRFENGPGGTADPFAAFVYADEMARPSDISIEQNEFVGGLSGIQLQNCFGFGCDTIPPTTGTRIVANRFRITDTTRDFRSGISLYHHDGPLIDRNDIETFGTAISLLSCSGPVRITNNRIDVRGTDLTTSVATGIRIVFPELARPFGLIASNMIRAHDPVYLDDAQSLLVGMNLGQSKNLFVVYNTVLVEDSASTSLPLDVPFGTDSVVLYNNILANFSGGPALRIKFVERFFRDFGFDYNLYHTTGDTLAIWNDTGRVDLQSIRNILGTDAHSLTGDPEFLSPTDLHIASTSPAVNRGFAFRTLIIDDIDYADLLAFDIDDEMRGLEVSEIGADELDVVGVEDEEATEVNHLQVRVIDHGVLGVGGRWDIGEVYRLKIFDMTGRAVLDHGERTWTGTEEMIQVSLPAGPYLVQITSESGEHSVGIVLY